jgi:glycosyltransferase involved in cell wall biosynthesis
MPHEDRRPSTSPESLRFSVVVPALNEAESLPELHEQIVASLSSLEGPFEIIYVDDGSTDDTAAVLLDIARDDPRTAVIQLPSNRGKSVAYSAGFDVVRGDVVLTLDADLQDDPAEIPVLLAALDEGHDLVIGFKNNRFRNEPSKTVPSRVFNGLKRLLFGHGLRDSNSGFRAMRRAVAQSLDLYGDQYRFLPELVHIAGFRVAEVGVQHRQRKHGKSKYGGLRFWTGLLDLLSVRFVTAYIHKPLHFFGTLGLAASSVGIGLEGYVLICKIMGDTFRTHLAAIIIGTMLVILGAQFLGIGLVGEMISASMARLGSRRRREPVVLHHPRDETPSSHE